MTAANDNVRKGFDWIREEQALALRLLLVAALPAGFATGAVIDTIVWAFA